MRVEEALEITGGTTIHCSNPGDSTVDSAASEAMITDPPKARPIALTGCIGGDDFFVFGAREMGNGMTVSVIE